MLPGRIIASPRSSVVGQTNVNSSLAEAEVGHDGDILTAGHGRLGRRPPAAPAAAAATGKAICRCRRPILNTCEVHVTGVREGLSW